jgi:hypothetical protein
MATCEWLLHHKLLPLAEGDSIHSHLICKAAPFGEAYIKTAVLKAGLICTFVEMFHPTEEILYIDDEQANLNEAKHYLNARTYTSLSQVFDSKYASSVTHQSNAK